MVNVNILLKCTILLVLVLGGWETKDEKEKKEWTIFLHVPSFFFYLGIILDGLF